MKLKALAPLILATLLSPVAAHATNHTLPESCGEMMTYNYPMAMCEGSAMPDMPMTMTMVQANAFVVGNQSEGPRAQNKIAAPNMFMLDYGLSLGDRNYANVDLMLTFEKWTFPKSGYPLLTQVGEENEDHAPFIDAQHPHSSPIMGLTFWDKFSFGESSYLKLFLSPRGEATDGPVAFMHRQSGQPNPDAPLGHHIGQDVGHITSSVIGAEYRRNKTTFEISTFRGEEPQPTQVDLPISGPDSYAARLTHQLSHEIYAMASVAYVKRPEAHDADLDHIWRYSFSMYTNAKFDSGWLFHDAFIYGLVNYYDHAGALNSFLYEAALNKERNTLWGRLEAVERTPDELGIAQSNDRATGRYVELFTLGFTRALVQHNDSEFSVGASMTKNFLPIDYQRDYGGNPLTGRIFAEVSGMKMFDAD
jgi:hypothetical protein